MDAFPRRMHGTVLLIAMLLLAAMLAAAMALQASTRTLLAQRDRLTERALAQAREALIAYATDRAINASVGPGYLPCPDIDNDGWAESTCGSLNGDSGQAQRLGRLPWKTLGLPDLRDGHGERLWYAVSTKYKGLLNCAASRACVDMSPPSALGTITVRDASGFVLHDGTIADAAHAASGGAAAVVLAPGAPLERDGTLQRRECAVTDCDGDSVCTTSPPQRAALCDPVNYLDRAVGLAGGDEDNAAFIDRSDPASRALNRDGFVQGPVTTNGRIAVNDRLAVITYDDLMPRMMRRVAQELAACLRFYASRPENATRYPWTAPACADTSGPITEAPGTTEGRVPDTPFTSAAAASMLPHWWRTEARSPEALTELPTHDDACRIALPPTDAGPARTTSPGTPGDEGTTAGSSAPSWWASWKPYVTLAIAPGFAPGGTPSPRCGDSACLQVLNPDGGRITDAASAVIVVRASASACSSSVMQCDAGACRVTAQQANALAWLP